MKDFKQWTGKERLASFAKTKAAIAAGIIPSPTICNRCGKTTGRIDYHNHDYSDPIKYLEQLCQGCHTRLHRLENKNLDSINNNGHISNDLRDITIKIPPVRHKNEGVLMESNPEINYCSKTASYELNSWLEKGMKLPLEELAAHIRVAPVGVKPLHALRGLGIVFSGGYTKLYNCKGYPQTIGLAKNNNKFEIILERVLFLERNGESLKIKGMPLSEKLKSNYAI
jgi:hypothetical protein